MAGRTNSGLAGVLSTVTMAQPYEGTNFGTVNSIAQTASNRGVIEHSKFGLNPLVKMRSEQIAPISLLLKRERAMKGWDTLLYGSLSGEAYAFEVIE